ncbi:MAG: tetratricopeptide repeat protein [Candidatus Heimdallarchaeota archaeon]|nr:tetratricopeptide repeat protein [Candidatus Heimdallarchaeota archaeon]
MNTLNRLSDILPPEFTSFLPYCESEELAVIEQIISSLDEVKYINLAYDLIAEVENHPGKYPMLEYLAARACYIFCQYDRLMKIAEFSQQPGVWAWKAQSLIIQGNYEESFTLLKKVESKAAENDDNLSLLEAMGSEAWILLFSGTFDQVSELISQARLVVEKCDNPELCNQILGKGYVAETWALLMQGKLQAGVKLCNELLQLLEPIGDRLVLSGLENSLGNAYLRLLQLDAARKHYRTAYEYSSQIGDKRGAAAALTNMGSVRSFQGDLEAAIRTYKKGIEIFSALGDARSSMAAHANIAEVNRLMGDYEKALNYALKAEQLIKKIGHREEEIYLLVASIYAELSKFDQADTYLKKAHKKIRGDESHYLTASLKTSEGLVELRRMNYASAEQLLKKALELADHYNVMEVYMTASIYLADLYLVKQMLSPSEQTYKSAMDYLFELKAEASDRKLHRFIAEIDVIQAMLYASDFQYEQAEQLLEAALELADRFNFPSLKEKAQAELERISYLQRSIDLKAKDDKEIKRGFLRDAVSFLKRTLRFASMMEMSDVAPPKVLLILSYSGLLLYSHYFDDEFKFNDLIASGFISAISTFSNKIMRSNNKNEGSLSAIKHGDFAIMLESDVNSIVALIAEEESQKLRRQLANFTKEYKELDINVDTAGYDQSFKPKLEALVEKIF